MPNNYFDVFDVAHVKHKENFAQVALRSIISTGIVCRHVVRERGCRSPLGNFINFFLQGFGVMFLH